MKVFELAVNEEQLELIQRALDDVVNEEGSSLLSQMIDDILHEGETDVVHGLCY